MINTKPSRDEVRPTKKTKTKKRNVESKVDDDEDDEPAVRAKKTKKKPAAIRKEQEKNRTKKAIVKRNNEQEAPKAAERLNTDYDSIQQKTRAILAISDARALIEANKDDALDGLLSESVGRLENALGGGDPERIATLTAILQDQMTQIQTRVGKRTSADNAGKAADLQAIRNQKRIALVVGNSNYRNVSALRNPANDAHDVAVLLKRIGFTVKELHDLDKDAFEEALSAFAEESIGSDLSMLYYAGHGIEVDKRNYLIPIDAKLKTDKRLRFEAIALDDILDLLDGVKGVRFVFLDACRNNPFAEGMRRVATRSVGRGFVGIEAPYGTVVSYSAKEGTVANDGSGRNSPFTAALLSHLAEPGLEIQFMLRRVRDSVRDVTDGEQEPFISASLPGEEIYLVPPVN
ncbi:MAG: caspase domain-containing protein [Parvibaculaceae bacterium]